MEGGGGGGARGFEGLGASLPPLVVVECTHTVLLRSWVGDLEQERRVALTGLFESSE
jgi:hypothetical protein